MERRLLIAVDDALPSKFAVQYAARLLAGDPAGRLDLINVLPAQSHFLLEEAERSTKAKAELNRLVRKQTEASRELLAGHRETAVRCGMGAERVEAVSLPRRQGVAKDLLEYVQDRRHDALVIGRSGGSGLQSLFFGSIPGTLLEHSQYIPVWLVDTPKPPAHFLVPVDGSTNSLRAVDHLVFLTAGLTGIRYTLFHVKPKLGQFCEIDFAEDETRALEEVVDLGAVRCIDGFYRRVRGKFAEFGISDDRVDIRTEEGLAGVGGVIVKAVASGDFDTVVMGRRGLDRSYFTGSVTRQVLKKVSDTAVWMVP